MKNQKIVVWLAVMAMVISCGLNKNDTLNESTIEDQLEDASEGRTNLRPELLESKPDFVLQEHDDGVKVVFYGFDFNMETRSTIGEKKAFYIDSPESVNFYTQRRIDGIMYYIYKIENGLVAIPQ
jgi:hypothetical protein